MKELTKVVIGIVGVSISDNENYDVVALYDNYRRMAFRNNCIPFMIPPVQDIKYVGTKKEEIPPLTEEEKNTYREMIDLCDGIILPGGSRIYDYCKFIINYAIEKNIPVLGTCLGMQALACVDNIDYCLEKNINDNHNKKGVDYAHKVRIVRNTLLSKILETNEIEVNSLHEYHVTHLNRFVPCAYSSDGLIEGIELPGKNFVIGVQWHPEKMINYDKHAEKLIKAFVYECKKNKLVKKEVL